MVKLRCLVLFATIFLSGCATSLSDIATGTGAVVGATAGSVIGGPAVVAITAGAGAVGGSLLVEEKSAADVCIENPEACTAAETGETIRDITHWIIGGAVILILAAWLLPGPQRLWGKAPTGSTGLRKRRKV